MLGLFDRLVLRAPVIAGFVIHASLLMLGLAGPFGLLGIVDQPANLGPGLLSADVGLWGFIGVFMVVCGLAFRAMTLANRRIKHLMTSNPQIADTVVTPYSVGRFAGLIVGLPASVGLIRLALGIS